jgi:hypothetical protein
MTGFLRSKKKLIQVVCFIVALVLEASSSRTGMVSCAALRSSLMLESQVCCSKTEQRARISKYQHVDLRV